MEGKDTRSAAFGKRCIGASYRTDRFGPLMDRFSLANLRKGIDPDAFWEWVQGFGVGYAEWFNAWSENRSNFLDVLAWGHDHDFGGGRVIHGTMDDRHVTNLERVVQPGGLNPAVHVKGKRVLVVGAYCGGEVLLMHALGAARVDAIEEVPAYADACGKLADAFGIEQTSYGMSIYDLPGAWTASGKKKPVAPAKSSYDLVYCPGVVYHCTDQVAAFRILRDLAVPGGAITLETTVKENPNETQYLGASHRGWNWWACGANIYVRIMADVGIAEAKHVETFGGRASFMGVRGTKDPLVENGCAGFSIPALVGRGTPR